ncbi:hypothetical protein HK100_012130 [Physocladia obscura]|uniref:Uncharacterized protein n=1 Tax=Physocladia obscura TaxID=109957 RepID=A0AAD5T344_9FUNG|nr:hypothetical protein HK100_012130 [Physocladia obscura]
MIAVTKQQQINTLETIEGNIKSVISNLSLNNTAKSVQDALDACLALEIALELFLEQSKNQSEVKDAARWDRALQNKAAAAQIQAHFIKFGYKPAVELNIQPNSVEPITPQKKNELKSRLMTPGAVLGDNIGGLVGANDFEDSNQTTNIGTETDNDASLISTPKAKQPKQGFNQYDDEDDEDDGYANLILRTRQGEDEDPPSPTLESLGISKYALGLLNGVISEDRNSLPVPTSSTSSANYADSMNDSKMHTPIAKARSVVALKYASSDASRSSPNVPEITPTPLHHHISDPNSIFGDLIRIIRVDEYAKLPDYLSAQMSLDLLNEMVTEINEYITDKRFQGMDDDVRIGNSDSLSLDELTKVAASIDSSKIKPVLVALLHLGRVTSHDDRKGNKRYLVA